LITTFAKYNENGVKPIFPTGINLDKEGNVYVSSNTDFEILKFNSNGTFIAGFGKR